MIQRRGLTNKNKQIRIKGKINSYGWRYEKVNFNWITTIQIDVCLHIIKIHVYIVYEEKERGKERECWVAEY